MNQRSGTFRTVIAGYGTAGSPSDAVALAGVLARTSGARLVLACVYPVEPAWYAAREGAEADGRAEAERQLREAASELPYGARVKLRAIPSRSVAQGLHELAEAEGADLIVVGGSHHPMAGMAWGGLAEHVLSAAPCAVAVAPPGFSRTGGGTPRVIGVAYDGSDEAKVALSAAEEIARASSATLRIIGVLEPAALRVPGMPALAGFAAPNDWARDQLHEALELAADSVDQQLRPLPVLATGSPAEEIADCAESLDLLVIGSRHYGPLRRVLLGSVSTRVMRSPECATIVVPRGAPAGGRELAA